jgi:hypothetical protein
LSIVTGVLGEAQPGRKHVRRPPRVPSRRLLPASGPWLNWL